MDVDVFGSVVVAGRMFGVEAAPRRDLGDWYLTIRLGWVGAMVELGGGRRPSLTVERIGKVGPDGLPG